MRSWTTKEARLVLEWARTPVEMRPEIEDIAGQLCRSTGAVQQFLRRVLPRGERPWVEKPRWTPEEVEAIEKEGAKLNGRSPSAIKKYRQRHFARPPDQRRKKDAAGQRHPPDEGPAAPGAFNDHMRGDVQHSHAQQEAEVC